MRLLAALLPLAAGCLPPNDPPPTRPPPPDDGWMGPQGDPIDGCYQSCGSLVCARDGGCYPASSIRTSHVRWTVGGEAASVETCTAHPDLSIQFQGGTFGDSFGFAPVPCENGLFTVDKLPTKYTQVELGPEGAASGTLAAIDPTTGDAHIDLP